MNPDWEKGCHGTRRVESLAIFHFATAERAAELRVIVMPERSLEERKLDYVHGLEARSPGAVNKSISELLARNQNDASNHRHPGVDEGLNNLESHLAMRYVPSPPVSLLHRIKFIEGHIMQLEREYPPWAALHFNQPRRGLPPPPRPTPVIVPSHLTSNPTTEPSASFSSVAESSIPPAPATYPGKAMTEVQRAVEDLKGEGEHC
ncbi:hypothetical protein BGW80DRAFT_1455596 [Lactifluus volemus]|nr:hypothetical protein BGW80DRAFT_1455596 [Lactifluus volemus]